VNADIDKLSLIHICDGRLLMARSRGKSTLYLPGGKRESGESDIEALSREIYEELNVEIDRETAIKFGEYTAEAHGKPAGTVLRMSCYTAKFTGLLEPRAEIEELVWVEKSDAARCSQAAQLAMNDLASRSLIK
jgi:8-oxo-dGTP diphosphatase